MIVYSKDRKTKKKEKVGKFRKEKNKTQVVLSSPALLASHWNVSRSDDVVTSPLLWPLSTSLILLCAHLHIIKQIISKSETIRLSISFPWLIFGFWFFLFILFFGQFLFSFTKVQILHTTRCSLALLECILWRKGLNGVLLMFARSKQLLTGDTTLKTFAAKMFHSSSASGVRCNHVAVVERAATR